MADFNFGGGGRPASAGSRPAASNANFDFGQLDDPALLDYSEGGKGIPWIDNRYVIQVLNFEIHDGYKFGGRPRLDYKVLAVETEGTFREHEGKRVVPAKPGEEFREFFDTLAGMVNGFDKGQAEKERCACMAAALKGLDTEAAKEAMAAKTFSPSSALRALTDATPEQIEGFNLRMLLEVTTNKSGKGAFYARVNFKPLPQQS